MEYQLTKMIERYPYLFSTIQNAVFNGYSSAKDYAQKNGANPFFKHRMGYVRHPVVEATVYRSVEELGLSGVQVLCQANSTHSAVHLEIHTPYGILVFASVQTPGDVPRKALYRQKYIDQCFMQEALPDLLPYSTECQPLYIVTHSPNRRAKLPADPPAVLCIGRPSVDQYSWSCHYRFDQLSLDKITTETIVPAEPAALKEEVAQKVLVTLKNA